MTVESASFISQLVTANPAASDNISEGDDHIRLVKSVLKSQFPNLATVAVSQSSAQMNKLGFEPGHIVMFASNTTPTTETISGKIGYCATEMLLVLLPTQHCTL